MTDILDRLEAANPYTHDLAVEQPIRSQEELFASLIGSDASTPVSDLGVARAERRGSRRRVGLVAAAMAAALAVAIGLLIVGPGATSAQAALTRAAQAAAGFDSGRAEVVVEGSGIADQTRDGGLQYSYRYDGTDYVYQETGQGRDGAYALEIRRVDDTLYLASPRNGGKFIAGSIDEFPSLSSFEATYALKPDGLGVNAIVRLIEGADDVEQLTTGATSTFGATLSPKDLARLSRDELPVGVTLLGNASDLAAWDTIRVEGTAEEGVLTEIVLRLDGTDTTGPITASITTELSELGRDQSITAPNDDDLLDVQLLESREELLESGSDPVVVDELFDDIAVMEDLMERRPRLCLDLTGSMVEGFLDIDDMRQLVAEQRALAECYREAGEQAAAAVSDRNADIWQRVLEQDVALADVEARRPGLCAEFTTFDGQPTRAETSSQRLGHIACLTEAGETQAAAAMQAMADNPSLGG